MAARFGQGGVAALQWDRAETGVHMKASEVGDWLRQIAGVNGPTSWGTRLAMV
jgi:hypothetical protein